MKIWYSHGELLAFQPAESPTNHYPNFLEHKEVFMTFHSNLSISSQYLESEYQMDLVSFLEVLQRSGPKADTLLLLLFFINARFYLVCVPLGAASVGIQNICNLIYSRKKREKALLSSKHVCDISLQPEQPFWVALYFVKTAL